VDLRKIIIGLAFVFAAGMAIHHKAHADDELIFLGASHHMNTETPHQERNWGFGMEHDDISVGAYRNSFNRKSIFALCNVYEHRFTDHLSFSLPAGIVTGYQREVIPTALPTFTYRLSKYLYIDVAVIPPIGTNPGIIGAQVRVPVAVLEVVK
jgi:hypothetical protein